jgi:NitT/TauT family transport system substrate-binding protein
MRPKTLRVVVIAVVALALVGAGVWWAMSVSPVKPQEERVTICQYGKVFIYMPLYVAEEKGYFRDEGLDVSLINGGGDDKTFAVVSSGQAQFGVADPTFTAIAREKGQPAAVIGTIVNGATFWGVTRKPGVPVVRTPADLRDLRIATYTAPSTNYTLMSRTLAEHQNEVGQAKVVQGAFGTLLAMLDADQADVAMELEPTVSQAVKGGARVVYSYPEKYGVFLFTGIYATDEYRAAHPEVCRKVVAALQRAMRYCHEDPAGATAVAQKVFPDVDPEVVAQAMQRLLTEKAIPEGVGIDPKAWANAVDLRIRVGDLKDRAAADAAIDPTFAAEAMTRYPTAARR